MPTQVEYRKIKFPLRSFQNARDCDPISAFGGVVACNFRINKQIAKEISMNFVEVICAKGFDKLSLNILKKKKISELLIFQTIPESSSLNIVF